MVGLFCSLSMLMLWLAPRLPVVDQVDCTVRRCRARTAVTGCRNPTVARKFGKRSGVGLASGVFNEPRLLFLRPLGRVVGRLYSRIDVGRGFRGYQISPGVLSSIPCNDCRSNLPVPRVIRCHGEGARVHGSTGSYMWSRRAAANRGTALFERIWSLL
ncbi:hypothetical protein B0H63DRAFT_192991 [Podospora didyma]|uniref:Secreted protein n=1 Tax=Podospora didyma TaxID=330526 RepID=A0AAE0NG33_9PEZI|nr:hypothetical protein B0H63DRAFT_192991 [Podospora didyma]